MDDSDDDTPVTPRLADDQLEIVLLMKVGILPLLLFSSTIAFSGTGRLGRVEPWQFICALSAGFAIPFLERAKWRKLGFMPIGMTLLLFSGLIALIISDWLAFFGLIAA